MTIPVRTNPKLLLCRFCLVICCALGCTLSSACRDYGGSTGPPNATTGVAETTPTSSQSRSDTAADKLPPGGLRNPVGSANAAEPENLSLPDEEGARIWDREHHANLLNQYGYKPLGVAIKSRDSPALLALLADEFTASVIENGETLDYHSDTVTASRLTAQGELRALPDRAAFVDWLFTTVGFITEIAGTQVGVLRISPIDDEEGSWRVEGVMRAWGRHGMEPGELRIWLQLTIAKPTQANLEAGQWLQRVEVKQVAHSRAAQPWFAERTRQSGIMTRRLHDNWERKDDVNSVTGGMYATDFNRDGNIDLLMTDIGSDLERLYEGTGAGTFVDVSSILGSTGRGSFIRSSICAAFVDIDGDGWDDLIYGDGVVRKNVGGTRFKDFSTTSNFAVVANVVHPIIGPAIAGIIPADFDRDGRIDLFIARIGTHPKSWLSATSPQTPPCQLLRNVGNWRFEDVTAKYGVDGGGQSTFSSVWSDFNNDGWSDLYTINEFGEGTLYVNHEGKRFEPRDIDPNALSFGAMGLTSGDIDNDGNIDVYAGEMYSKAGSRVIGNMRPDAYEPAVMRRLLSLVDGSELYRNLGGFKFEAQGKQLQVHDVGWSWGPCLADFDNDGLLDIYATAGYISRDRDKPDG